MEQLDLAIIGGGPAAITLAKNIKGNRKITIFRPEDHSMIYCAMPYAIEGLIEFEKTLKQDTLVTEVGADLVRESVTDINFEEKTFKTESNQAYTYEELIIATGAEPFLPPIKGIDLPGVRTFKTEKDLEKLMDSLRGNLKEAVVVGAGAIGIELAQALNAVAVETHLVDVATTILPNMMDEDMMANPMDSIAESGIHMHLGEKVVGLEGKTYVERLQFESGQQLDFQTPPLVVFAVGMRPSVDLFKDSTLEIGRSGIIVNDKMATNIEGVYAVGDCCEYTSAITGQVSLGKLATNAVPMARLLAKNLLGADRKYPGFYNGAATKVMSYFVGSTGLKVADAQKAGIDVVVGKAKMTTAFPIMPFTKSVEIKLVADKATRKIIGGQLVSGEPVTDKVDQITMATQFGHTIDELVALSYSSQPYQSFYPANNLLVEACERMISEMEEQG